MRKYNRIAFLLLLTFSVSTAAGQAAELLDWVVAIVNGQPITNGQLQETVTAVLLGYKGHPSESEMKSLKQETLNRLIDDTLLVTEAERQGISMSERELDVMTDQELSTIKSRYDSIAAFNKQLDKAGLSEESLRRNLREEMLREYLMKSLIQRRIISSVEVTNSEVKEFQENNPEMYAQLEKIRLSHILLRCPEDMSQQQEQIQLEKAKMLITRRHSGEKFADLASKYSEHETSKEEGGDLGLVSHGDLLPEIENVAFSMNVGEISAPIRTKLGYHVIMVTGKQNPKEYLISVKAKEKMQEFVDKLREKAQIEILDESYIAESEEINP